MALLSHWHPDICQQVKVSGVMGWLSVSSQPPTWVTLQLASNAEARKFRADPASIRREVRLPIEPPDKKTDLKHRRNPSRDSRSSRVSQRLSYHTAIALWYEKTSSLMAQPVGIIFTRLQLLTVSFDRRSIISINNCRHRSISIQCFMLFTRFGTCPRITASV